jgi:alkylated DNA repair dioxygenase AlkB
MAMAQLALFGRGEAPSFDPAISGAARVVLADGAWIDLARGWLSGHAQVFEELLQRVQWRAERRMMYDKEVEVPRLYAELPAGEQSLPVIEQMRSALDARYGCSFERTSFALYRDGNDSVAWHGDYVAREMNEAVVATVSVGAPRRFLLRRTGGGKSIALSLGWGDLLVMGGTCQRVYQHAIPKVRQALPRISILMPELVGDRPPPGARCDSVPSRRSLASPCHRESHSHAGLRPGARPR